VLRQRAISGAKWTTLSAAATGAVQVVQFTVLAWILARADFGLMSMTMVVVGLGQMLADLGIGAAIIQRQQSSADELTSLYWLNVLAGVILFGALFAAAPIGARLFAEPRLTELIRLASFSLLIIPIGQQFEVLLQRDLGFRQLAGIEVGSAAIGLGVGEDGNGPRRARGADRPRERAPARGAGRLREGAAGSPAPAPGAIASASASTTAGCAATSPSACIRSASGW